MTRFPSDFRPALIAFDLDGTLINSMGDIASSVNRALVEQYGLDRALPIDAVRGFVGGGARQLIERCLMALARPLDDATPVLQRFLRIYRARAVETTCLYPGMRETLHAARHQAKLAVLTNKPGDLSRLIVSQLGLDGLFVEVIGGDDLKTKKPEPEGIFALAALAGVAPECTALVGDSAVDVLAARNAGAFSIGAIWGYDRAGMEQQRPDVFVRAPGDILQLLNSGMRKLDWDPRLRPGSGVLSLADPASASGRAEADRCATLVTDYPA